MNKHIPVLVSELISGMQLVDGGIYIDATFGAGGHTKAILEANPTVSVIAFDWDKQSLKLYAPELQEQYGERVTILWSNFTQIYRSLNKKNINLVDGIIADFGTSMMHFKERPGFSFAIDTILDMRMSPGHQKIQARDILQHATVKELIAIFFQGGEEKWAYKFAYAIIEARKKKKIETTGQLVSVLEEVSGKTRGKSKIHPLTKAFQALRIAVNKELDNIHAFLINSFPLLKKKGKLACISFHSLEDRKVKEFFVLQSRMHTGKIITKKPITATKEEILRNHPSRSAKLRIIEKL